MRPAKRMVSPAWLLTGLVLLSLSVYGLTEEAVNEKTKEQVRRDARDLFESTQYTKAIVLYEKLADWYPDDPGIVESLGFCIFALSESENDLEKRKAARIRAREVLLRAREKGSNSNLLTILLERLPADGGTESEATSPEALALQEGEQAFVAGDFDGALKAYAKVLELDPKNYHAMLFTGDVYYKEKDYQRAGKWFEKATAVEPSAETAWRYWGDALVREGKLEDAKAKFVEAIVAQPYTKRTWIGLQQWAEVAKRELRHPSIEIPVIVDPADPSTLTIGKKTVTDERMQPWLLYGVQRVLWKDETFGKTFPGEKTYRHSLDEEVAALTLVAANAQRMQKEGKGISEDLAQLVSLSSSGLLAPYVLFALADQGISQDYEKYRAEHADLLRQYLVSVYIGVPVKKQQDVQP